MILHGQWSYHIPSCRVNPTRKAYTMSKETVKKFYEVLKNDKAMVEELQQQAAVEEKTQENVAALVVRFAASKGYEFTIEDLKAFETEVQELGVDDLDKVNAAAVTFLKLKVYDGKQWHLF